MNCKESSQGVCNVVIFNALERKIEKFVEMKRILARGLRPHRRRSALTHQQSCNAKNPRKGIGGKAEGRGMKDEKRSNRFCFILPTSSFILQMNPRKGITTKMAGTPTKVSTKLQCKESLQGDYDAASFLACSSSGCCCNAKNPRKGITT